MAAPADNILKQIETINKKSLVKFYNYTQYIQLADTTFKDWNKAVGESSRGGAVFVELPQRISTLDGLGFDPAAVQNITEEYTEVVLDKAKTTPFALSDEQLATYDADSIVRKFGDAAIAEMATLYDQFAAQRLTYSGYRFAGDPLVKANQFSTIDDVSIALGDMRQFGGMAQANAMFPIAKSVTITNSMLKQFATKRNDEDAIRGEIGEIPGIPNTNFYQSNIVVRHVAGDVAATVANETGFDIKAIDNNQTAVLPGTQTAVPVSLITIEGVDTGKKIKVDDLIQLKPNATADGANGPLNLLTWIGHINNGMPVQCRVLTADTEAGADGELQFKVYPQLVHDSNEIDPLRNISRDLSLSAGGNADKVQVVRSHIRAPVFLDGYLKFTSPRLGSKKPYDTVSQTDPRTKLSLRSYHGAILDKPTTYYVFDKWAGCIGISPGVYNFIFPYA